MSWCAVDVRSPAGSRDAIASWLVRHTGQAIEEREDGTLTGFSDSADRAAELLRDLQRSFAGVRAETRTLPEVDWTTRWREGIAPRTLGRLTVTTSWMTEGLPRGAVVVVIDPENAFGTGEHGSTRTALALLEGHLAPGARVLDLGSGSGILAIASVRLGASRATGIDNDPEAEPIAAANAEKNGVAGRAAFVTGDATLLTPLLAPADLVLSNILRTVNLTLLPVIRAALAPGGLAIFAGMEREEREAFLPALADAGFLIVAESEDAGWWGVAARPA